MAQAATKTFDITTMAEDIEDVIYNISPMDTWAFTNFKKKKASNRYHQWVTDALATPAANSQLEGDDASYTTAVTHTVYGNYTNISRKTVEVSGTADAVKQYGLAEKFAYEIAKVGKELKRDIETMLLGNQASTAGAKASARVSAGLECMISGNRTLSAATDTTGTTPGFSGTTWAAPTDGTTASLTETVMQTALQAAWTDGGDPSVILCGPALKRQIAGFAGANKFAGFYNPKQGASQGMVIGGVDVYISDFGEHKIMLSRYCRSRTLFALDPDYVSMAWLRPIKYEALAKVGDGSRGMLIGEWTLVCDNPDAHAKVQDLV